MAQSHTPHDCCVRFAAVVTFHDATLTTGRALPLTRTGFAPAGSRQLRLAHQWLAYALPHRRFDGTLADAAARLGADVVCYSFIVADFHHLLLAGFAGAPVCENYATSHDTTT